MGDGMYEADDDLSPAEYREQIKTLRRELDALKQRNKVAFPNCGICGGKGYVGSPPDSYEDCPGCLNRSRAEKAEAGLRDILHLLPYCNGWCVELSDKDRWCATCKAKSIISTPAKIQEADMPLRSCCNCGRVEGELRTKTSCSGDTFSSGCCYCVTRSQTPVHEPKTDPVETSTPHEEDTMSHQDSRGSMECSFCQREHAHTTMRCKTWIKVIYRCTRIGNHVGDHVACSGPNGNPPYVVTCPSGEATQIKVVWEQLGAHIHCNVFQGKGEGYTWQNVGKLVFDSDGFAAFTKPWATVWVIEGKKS